MVKDIIRTARPEHYVKNLLVFAPIVFAGELFAIPLLLNAIWTFVMFCLAASSVYFFNDICDREYDLTRDDKKNRPVAAGIISPLQAGLVSGGLFISALLIAYFLVNFQVAVVVIIYIFINVLYSLKLKHTVLIDIILIAMGFILRILAGGLAITVPISDWLLLCVGSLALFLALAKRRSEFIRSDVDDEKGIRKVLEHYSEKMLDLFIAITATLSIITYSLYSILNEVNVHLIFTTPFVIYGIFRYLYLIYRENRGANPEKEMLRDKPLLLAICLWALTSIVIITYFQ